MALQWLLSPGSSVGYGEPGPGGDFRTTLGGMGIKAGGRAAWRLIVEAVLSGKYFKLLRKHSLLV